MYLVFRDQPHAWLNCTTGKVVLTYKKHVWLRICLAICQLMRHGPCQIWFPLTFMQKESQTQFTLWVAYNIVFQGNVVIFVLATEAVSGDDRQMALVTVSMKLSVLGYAIGWLETGNQPEIPVEVHEWGVHAYEGHVFIWQVGSRLGRQYEPPGKGQEYNKWAALTFAERLGVEILFPE